MIYRCCDENRRLLILGRPDLNGIDYLEVLDNEAPAGTPRQQTLLVRFVNPAPVLDETNFEITGGERVTGIAVSWATPADAPVAVPAGEAGLAALLTALPDAGHIIALRTTGTGDFSTYTLHLVASAASLAPPPGIDPLLARVKFSFKVECPSDFDCAPANDCEPAALPAPPIDYLAKDYGSFRRLMLDRMAQTIPEWQERNAADLGVALVEVLAYVGDRLSYAQDAVATEAYLGTARRRPSVRRHARLVDYRMHDGANARVFVQVRADGGPATIAGGPATKFLTRVAEAGTVIAPGTALDRALMQAPLVFEAMHDLVAHPALNEIAFHDWGESECTLPRGAARATLRGDLGMLQPGDVLVFAERLGPRTGRESDADPTKRWPVRLVQVAAGLTDPATNPPTPITEIRWADEDALPFAFCLSARRAVEFGGDVIHEVSHVLGNIMLADHGLTVEGVDIGTVPEPHLFLVGSGCDPCAPQARRPVPPRFNPLLPDAPVTQAAPFTHPPASAAAARRQVLREVRPSISARVENQVWESRGDLLASGPSDEHFVVEIEADGRARLRFGDSRNGRRPASGSAFVATYRIGNGPGGNIGSEAIQHIVTNAANAGEVRNPLPGVGGLAPESMATARLAAGYAYRTQERAVTEADYAEVARRHPDVQRAAATIRWNGHGHTVFVTVDRFDGRPVSAEFRAELVAFLEPYRMAGYDVTVDAPRFVSLDLAIEACVKPAYFRSAVRQAILEVLSDRRLPGGQTGFFHPDNWTFGENVWLSRIVALVASVDGVESVTPTRFTRLDAPEDASLADGVLGIGRLEIAQLANNPNFPERGKLSLTLGGGK